MLLRHDLLQAEPRAWNAMLRRNPTLASTHLVASWVPAGFPIIVRRRLSTDASDAVPAALPLPPSHGKRRIAFTLPSEAVTALPHITLRDAAASVPEAWQRLVADLLRLGDAVGVAPRVFGAVLWQHVTRLPYLSAHSDLDLLWPIADGRRQSRLLRELTRLDADGPVRIDGELLLSDGRGVNWREVAQASNRSSPVLVKTLDSITTCRLDELFDFPVPV